MEGRIVALVDVNDALTHNRVYRDVFSEGKTLSIMEEVGNHFDPDLFEVFEEALPKIRQIRNEHTDDEPLTRGNEITGGLSAPKSKERDATGGSGA